MGIFALRPALRAWAVSGTRLSGGGGGASLDADALTLFAAMDVQPDATRKALISTFFTSLKAAGVFAKLDRLWVMAAHDSQAARLNWINPAVGSLTAVNSPTFTTDQGYAGDGSTSYLNTGFVPSTDGVKYTRNDASMGVYSRTQSSTTRITEFGHRTASTFSHIDLQALSAETYARINMGTVAAIYANASTTGLFVARRTGASAHSIWHNGTSVAMLTQVSQSLINNAMYIDARNNAGSAERFSARQLAVAFVGAAMSTQQQADLFTIVESYLDSIGAGVVA